MKAKLLLVALACGFAASCAAQTRTPVLPKPGVPPLDVRPTPQLVYKVIDDLDEMASGFEQAAGNSRKYAMLFPEAADKFVGAAESYEEAAKKVRAQIVRVIEALAATANLPSAERRPMSTAPVAAYPLVK